MWSGRCLLHDMKHVERREQGECLGYRAQSQWDAQTQSQLVVGVISLQQWRLSTPDLDHTLSVPFRILPGLLFCLRTEEDSASSLPVCLCRSWLQMCLCRGSLDLRRTLVRTAPGVATSWTLTADAFPPQAFKSPPYIFRSGMTWTQCQILVCGRYCPTLTCHISSVELVCAGPKGIVWSGSVLSCMQCQSSYIKVRCRISSMQSKKKSLYSDHTGDLACSFCPREWQHRCFSLCLHSVTWADLWGHRE